MTRVCPVCRGRSVLEDGSPCTNPGCDHGTIEVDDDPEDTVSDVRDPEHDQPAPVPNDGPSMHDLVIRDIASRDPRWDLGIGTARHLRDQVAADLQARRDFGLQKYKTLLQAGNGRDFLLDLYQEMQDASVYARGRLAELDESSVEYLVLFEIYDNIVTDLVRVRRLRNAVATE